MTAAPPASGAFPRPRDWLLLALGLGVLFGGLLGTRGLNEPDEGRYANIALAMARPGGDWWEPRMSGYAHYDKPPLIYWATALSFRLFGLNEWAARLPSLLGAALALGGLGWAAWRLRGARAAWWAVLICGTSVQFWTLGRVLTPDMLLTGWCALAVAAWAEGRHRGGPWGWWLLSLGFWSLAWWTKATPALVPLAGLATGVWLADGPAGRRALRLLFLLPGVLALGSPWYLSMLARYPELQHFFFGRELAGRAVSQVHGRHGLLFYYLPVCLLGWLPWWLAAAWAGWRGRADWPTGSGWEAARAWARRLGVEGWIVAAGLLIFSLAGSKLPTYTLTLAPWAALCLARLIVREAGTGCRPGWLILPGVGFAALAMLGVALLPARFEASWGANSSLRAACQLLRARGAARVDSERYLPGLEFYLDPGTVHYVVRTADSANLALPGHRRHPVVDERFRERPSDPGVPPHRFIEPALWPALTRAEPPLPPVPPGGWWLLRYRKQDQSPFQAMLDAPGGRAGVLETVRVGDFELYRLARAP